MDVYMTDEEKVEALKKWIKQNGLPILIGIALALGGSYGWRAWKQHKANVGLQSSAAYEQMLGAMIEGKESVSKQFGHYLMKDFASTPYAALAALTQAHAAVQDKQLPVAQEKLQWVIDHAKQPVFRQIARLRLARVYLDLNKPQQALDNLTIVEDDVFLPLIDEFRGDAYVLLQNPKAAREAYQLALSASGAAGIKQPLLKMKLDQV